MNCGEFRQRIDAVLAGDIQAGPSLTHHGESCASCRPQWVRVRAVTASWQAASTGDEPTMVSRARDSLRQGFVREGRPPVRYDWLRTPIGPVFVGVSDQGVCDVTFDGTTESAYRARLAQVAPEVSRDRDAVEPALTELDAYFSGTLRRFTVAVDLRAVTRFTSRVLGATRNIPFGRLLSYGEVAERIGSPSASRAVGGALGRNPVPIIVPCHRVVAHGGGLGGFTGGVETKRKLLHLEGHEVAEARLLLF